MVNRYAKIARESANETDEQNRSEILQLTKLKDEEISALFPEKVDKEKMCHLLKILKTKTDDNEKAIKLQDDIVSVSKVVVKVLKHFL